MRILLVVLAAYLLAGSQGCGDPPAPTTAETVTPPQRDTCTLSISALPGNRYTDFTAEEKVLLYGTENNSKWRLDVYDLYSCALKATYGLPANYSPDYPYYLADLIYNNGRRIVGVRGYEHLLLVDLDFQQLSKPIKPDFPGGRLTDAESGAIQHLEVWEDYLVGTTTDWGCFVFGISDSFPPKPLLPAAELAVGGAYYSLFLIPAEGGKYQAILPRFDADEGDFIVTPLFEEPIALDPEGTIYAKGSPYARVREASGSYIGVELETGKLLPVIEEKVPN